MEEEPEDDFEPLRKKLKRKSTGKEDNFMPSYFQESVRLATLTQGQLDSIMYKNQIEMEGDNCPRVIEEWGDAIFSQDILTSLSNENFAKPSPIQMAAVPCLMSGRDILAVAETGAGKTLAFLIPLIMFLKRQLPTLQGQGPLAIIIAPTRELTQQIFSVLDGFLQQFLSSPYLQEGDINASCYPRRYRALGVCGGVPLSGQKKSLSEGIDVVIATPGRLLDLVDRSAILLDRLHYLVFDEVDRLLSNTRIDSEGTKPRGPMEEQLRAFLSKCNLCPRQTALFSATIPASVERLARSALINEIKIQVGTTWSGTSFKEQIATKGVSLIPQNITQEVIFLHSYQKPIKVLEVLRRIEAPPVIIFCSAIHVVNKVVENLRKEQFHVAGIHSEFSQGYRFRVMHAFKEGKLDVMVATDVASRGLDITDVNTVLIYDMPDDIETYIHRVGRTGRAGQEASAITFLTYHCKCAKELRRLLQKTKQDIPRELETLQSFGKNVTETEFGDRVARRDK